MVKALAMELFREMDSDGEGLLDWSEFKSYSKVD